MRLISRAIVLTSLVSLTGACGIVKRLLGEEDAGADSGAALPAVDTAAADAAKGPVVVNAKNAADVARFPAEALISDDDMRLAGAATARTAPKTGAVVATVKPGSDVVKIAEYQESVLVTFADPKDPNVTLMGWIAKESFTPGSGAKKPTAGDASATSDASTPSDAAASSDASTPSDAAVPSDAAAPKDASVPTPSLFDGGILGTIKRCPKGQVNVLLAGRTSATCRKKCTKDADCRGGAAGACTMGLSTSGAAERVCAAGE